MSRLFLAVVVITLTVLYFFADILFKKPGARSGRAPGGPAEESRRREARNESARNYWTSETEADRERRHMKVLELPADADTETIKRNYKELLGKYHPDKVQHLGPEFQEMAEKKTREILEAYEYFSTRRLTRGN